MSERARVCPKLEANNGCAFDKNGPSPSPRCRCRCRCHAVIAVFSLVVGLCLLLSVPLSDCLSLFLSLCLTVSQSDCLAWLSIHLSIGPENSESATHTYIIPILMVIIFIINFLPSKIMFPVCLSPVPRLPHSSLPPLSHSALCCLSCVHVSDNGAE